MPTKPTFDELLTGAQDAIEAAAPEVQDYRPGTAAYALTYTQALMAEQSIAVSLDAFNDSFVATAEGEALDRRITDFGGPVRLEATAAVVPLTLQRGLATGDVTIAAGSAFRGMTPNGQTVTFETSEDVTLLSAASSVDFEATCTVTGRFGNVPAGTLTSGDIPTGTLLVHDERAAGGTDAETDEDYRARYALFRRVQARGTKAALEYGAKLVRGVTFAEVNEDNIDPDDGGYVAVYVGDPDAGSNSTLVDAVEAELELWRAAGVEVLVFGTEREERAFTITAKKRAGADLTTADLKASLIAYLDGMRVASKLYLSQAEGGIHGDFDDADLLSVVVTDNASPSSREITPSQSNYAIRTAADGSDITVVLTEV